MNSHHCRPYRTAVPTKPLQAQYECPTNAETRSRQRQKVVQLTLRLARLSVNKSRVRTRQIGPSTRSEVRPWVSAQGEPSDKVIGPICPFPKGLTPMRGLLCRPARAWGLPRPSPSFAYPIALGSNASRDLLTDKL